MNQNSLVPVGSHVIECTYALDVTPFHPCSKCLRSNLDFREMQTFFLRPFWVVLSFFKGLFKGVLSFFEGLFQGVLSFFKGLFGRFYLFVSLVKHPCSRAAEAFPFVPVLKGNLGHWRLFSFLASKVF